MSDRLFPAADRTVSCGHDLDRFAGHVRLIDFSLFADRRGDLVEYDFELLPFVPRRIFTVRRVPVGIVRGGHAHQTCQQMLVCLLGRMTVEVASKAHRSQIVLLEPSQALYIDAGIWSSQRYEEAGTVLLVLSSEAFDADRYSAEPWL